MFPALFIPQIAALPHLNYLTLICKLELKNKKLYPSGLTYTSEKPYVLKVSLP